MYKCRFIYFKIIKKGQFVSPAPPGDFRREQRVFMCFIQNNLYTLRLFPRT